MSATPALAFDWSFGKGEQVQGNGKVKRQAREVGHFNGLALALPGQVEVRSGNSEGVSIETDDNLLPLIETVVEDGTLKIRNKNRVNIRTRNLKIVVQTRGVDRLALAGSGSIDADRVSGSRLQFDVGGSGSIRVGKAEGESISVNLGGSGDLKVDDGGARSLSATIGGSGTIDMARGARRQGQRDPGRLGRRHRVGAQQPGYVGGRLRRRQLLRRSAGQQDRGRLRHRAPPGRRSTLMA
jgi:hypothetical protein